MGEVHPTVMPLRLLEVYHPYLDKEALEEILEDIKVLEIWQTRVSEDELHTRLLVRPEQTDAVIERLGNHFTNREVLRVVVLPVEASLPRPEEPKAPKTEDREGEGRQRVRMPTKDRASVEEIYQDMVEASGLTWSFVTMMVLASIVASVGILLNDVAIIIGSMVIAPLLNPNISLALAATLADGDLARRALITSVAGYLIAFGVGVAFGVAYGVNTGSPQILARTDISLLFVLVALSSGVAGALTTSKGVPGMLIGVMVAVALLPPLVACGLLAGDQHWPEALGAGLLFAMNVVSIKLTSVLTFVLQGISPSAWMEKERARRLVRVAVAVWISLLIAVVVMIVVYERYHDVFF